MQRLAEQDHSTVVRYQKFNKRKVVSMKRILKVILLENGAFYIRAEVDEYSSIIEKVF